MRELHIASRVYKVISQLSWSYPSTTSSSLSLELAKKLRKQLVGKGYRYATIVIVVELRENN